MTREETIQALLDDMEMPYLQDWQAEDIVDFVIKNYKPEPKGLDEAAEEYARTTFTQPYSETPEKEITIIEPDKLAGFKAGAKWMAEQGFNTTAIIISGDEGTLRIHDFDRRKLKQEFKCGDKVIMQIRRKE